MERYRPLFEYDPRMMKKLYRPNDGNTKKQYVLPDWVNNWKVTVVQPNINKITKDSYMRLVLFNDNIYTISYKEGIHMNIISWLLFNRGLSSQINEQMFLSWSSDYATKVPFLCLQQCDKNPMNLYLSESYRNKVVNNLAKIAEKKFSKELSRLRKQGFNIIYEIYKKI